MTPETEYQSADDATTALRVIHENTPFTSDFVLGTLFAKILNLQNTVQQCPW